MAMHFFPPAWKAIWKRPALSLGRVLKISWWVILGLFVLLLFLDGLIFYQFGLGYGIEPLPGEVDESASFRVREYAVREAASKIEERLDRFNATSSVPADIPNPFR